MRRPPSERIPLNTQSAEQHTEAKNVELRARMAIMQEDHTKEVRELKDKLKEQLREKTPQQQKVYSLAAIIIAFVKAMFPQGFFCLFAIMMWTAHHHVIEWPEVGGLVNWAYDACIHCLISQALPGPAIAIADRLFQVNCLDSCIKETQCLKWLMEFLDWDASKYILDFMKQMQVYRHSTFTFYISSMHEQNIAGIVIIVTAVLMVLVASTYVWIYKHLAFPFGYVSAFFLNWVFTLSALNTCASLLKFSQINNGIEQAAIFKERMLELAALGEVVYYHITTACADISPWCWMAVLMLIAVIFTWMCTPVRRNVMTKHGAQYLVFLIFAATFARGNAETPGVYASDEAFLAALAVSMNQSNATKETSTSANALTFLGNIVLQARNFTNTTVSWLQWGWHATEAPPVHISAQDWWIQCVLITAMLAFCVVWYRSFDNRFSVHEKLFYMLPPFGVWATVYFTLYLCNHVVEEIFLWFFNNRIAGLLYSLGLLNMAVVPELAASCVVLVFMSWMVGCIVWIMYRSGCDHVEDTPPRRKRSRQRSRLQSPSPRKRILQPAVTAAARDRFRSVTPELPDYLRHKQE
jgi:hypothetical protein